MLLPSDMKNRLSSFLKKVPPNENILEAILTRITKTDSSIIKYTVGKSHLTDSFCGHFITKAGLDIQYHFYYKNNHFTQIELVDIVHPEDFEVIVLE